MKKFFLAAVVAAAALMTSCNGSGSYPSLKNDVDTLSYEIGLAQGSSSDIAAYLQQNGLDSTMVDEFMKGMKEGMKIGEKKGKALAYQMGVQAGIQTGMQLENMDKQVFADSTQHLSRQNVIAGMMAGVHGKSRLKTADGKVMNQQAAGEDAMKRMQTLRAKQYETNLKAGQAFIAKKSKEAGVQALGNGIYYKVLTQGTGKMAAEGNQVTINYEGKTIDGKVFDSNYDKEATPVIPAQMIPGFKTILTKMPEGSEWEVYLPADQAYGERGAEPKIQPQSALIFKVKVVKVGEAPQQPQMQMVPADEAAAQ